MPRRNIGDVVVKSIEVPRNAVTDAIHARRRGDPDDGGRRPGHQADPVVIQPDPGGSGLYPFSLVQFVLTARVDLLMAQFNAGRAREDQLKRGTLAKSQLGWSDSELSNFLKGGFAPGSRVPRLQAQADKLGFFHKRRLSKLDRIVRQVDEFEAALQHMTLVTNAGTHPDDLPWVSTLWQEMLGTGETAPEPSVHHARWFHGLVQFGPSSVPETLFAGEALLSLLSIARNNNDIVQLLDGHHEQLERTVRALVAVSTKAPGKGSLPALHLAAQLGLCPLHEPARSDDRSEDWGTSRTLGRGTILDVIEEHIRHAPAGFRAMRIVTRMLDLTTRDSDSIPEWWSDGGAEEKEAIWELLKVIDDSRGEILDPYPARSFLVEAFRSMYDAASTGDIRDDVLGRLANRAKDGGRPVRERMYAAYLLHHYRSSQLDDVRRSFSIDASSRGGEGSGLEYAVHLLGVLHSSAKTIEQLLISSPHLLESEDRPEAKIVREVVSEPAKGGGELLPHTIGEATKQLVTYALLTLDGTMRRKACESLREAGVGPEAARLFGRVLARSDAPRWLKETAAFLLGHLGDRRAAGALLDAVDDGAGPAVVHAALWGIGDLAIRNTGIVDLLLDDKHTNNVTRPEIVMAATYALAVLRPEPDCPPDDVDGNWRSDDHLKRLADLAGHDNREVRSLAQWGLAMQSRVHARAVTRADREVWGIAPIRDSISG
jgi:hypothetical protein